MNKERLKKYAGYKPRIIPASKLKTSPEKLSRQELHVKS